MNENLDDFLNRMGIEQTVPDEAEAVEVTEEAATSIVSAASTPENMSEDEFNHLLNEVGFQNPPEAEAVEIHDGSDDTTEWEEENSEEEYNEDRDRAFDAEERTASVSSSEQGAVYVGNGIADQLQNVTSIGSGLRFDGDNVVADDGTIVEEPANIASETIPENSPTLTMDDTTSRFSGAEWYDKIREQNIILAGLGGIGSHLTLQLARMKPQSLFLYDDDVVESGNMSGQLYGNQHIGERKAQAMRKIIEAFCNMPNLYTVGQRFTEDSEAGDIMMCGFDNMAARRTFFESWHNHVIDLEVEERKKCLFLDGRLSVDTLQVFCLTGDDTYNINRYVLEYLFDDSEAEETICSLKQTTYMACMIGSFMVNLFTNFCGNLCNPIIPYDLPFFTEYDSQSMIFKTVR